MKLNCIPYLLLLVFLTSVSSRAQKIVPPLDIPLKLSGTFGEFRPTHFHAGLDIKTQGKEGFEVKSIDAGSIRRIRVTTTGYGKALYIEHANGTTSVYAHLKKFAPKIQALIKTYQYEKKTFVIQKFLSLGELTVDKGELIGYSGNTGGSMGPHLHFEIRDTKKETPLNPLQLGLAISDSIRPIVQGLYLYDINDKRLGEKAVVPLTRKNDSVYTTDVLSLGGNKAFGVRLFDRQDNSYNRNGVYKAELKVNGVPAFGYTFNSIDFKDGKKIDALIDYATYKNERIRIQKLFNNLEAEYSFLDKNDPDGILSFEADRAYQLVFQFKDFSGNSTYIQLFISGIEETKTPPIASAKEKLLLPEKDYLFEDGPYTLYIPKQSFYQPTGIAFKVAGDTLNLETDDTPQKKGFDLTFRHPELDSLGYQQMCLAKFIAGKGKKKDRWSYVPMLKKESHLRTQYAYPGQYIFTRDSLAPSIVPKNFRKEQWVSNYQFLEVEIEDDFSGIASYEARINGEWILMEHEPKNNTLTFDFDDLKATQARLEFKLIVKDQVGNTALFETNLFRKPKTR